MCLFVYAEVVLLSGTFASLTSGHEKCNLIECLKMDIRLGCGISIKYRKLTSS